MRRSLFIGLFMGCLAAAAAFSAEIRGRVVGAADDPIAGAVVLQRSSGVKTETDAQGRFALNVPDAGRFVLEVIHPD